MNDDEEDRGLPRGNTQHYAAGCVAMLGYVLVFVVIVGIVGGLLFLMERTLR